MVEFAPLVHSLCLASQRDYQNPYEKIDWPTCLKPDEWCFSPELLSIYGTEVYDQLTEREKQRLSFFETVNFFSLNIHGEKSLVEGLARRLYRTENLEFTPYLQHFLDEENKHMVYFGGFCMRYAGKIYPNKKLSFPAEFEPGEEEFIFFAKIFIFEEIVDAYNVHMARDERLAPVARRINLLHHRDEARHLAFGRELVKRLFEQYAPTWSAETLQRVRDYLKTYILSAWKEYYNPAVYRDAGLAEPFVLRNQAFQHPQSHVHRRAMTARCLHYLLTHKMLEEEPML